MTVKFVVCTPAAENHIAYVARVSNPKNQSNSDSSKLIKYCINHKHWSVFESAYMTLEINTSRAVSAQILRHRSFTFQEFSLRYSKLDSKSFNLNDVIPELRTQSSKNRQSSENEIEKNKKIIYEDKIFKFYERAIKLYEEMLENGIAKECARFVLPLGMPTTMYMTGNIRSWIHYIELRNSPETQKEHRNIAKECKEIFVKQFPIISEALQWT